MKENFYKALVRHWYNSVPNLESFVLRELNLTTGKSVIVQGISNSFVSVPLHRIRLTCNLVSSPVEVEVSFSLPMKVISLLGNELAGGRVPPHLE